jgi:hypothetical protein
VAKTATTAYKSRVVKVVVEGRVGNKKQPLLQT